MTNVRLTPTDNGPYQPPIHRPNRRLDITPEVAIAVVESFMEEAWAACNPSAVDRFVTEDFVITSAGVDVAGRENFKAWVAGFQSKIADLKWEPIETFANADGSRVSSRFRVTGRNNGIFGLPAHGKPIALTGNAILAVTPAGKLAHNWIERSAWELYNQLKARAALAPINPASEPDPRLVRRPPNALPLTINPSGPPPNLHDDPDRRPLLLRSKTSCVDALARPLDLSAVAEVSQLSSRA